MLRSEQRWELIEGKASLYLRSSAQICGEKQDFAANCAKMR
jgi:hypothetical protein